MSEFIKTDRDGPVLTITLNRPAVLNALHAPACDQLSRVLDDYIADDSLWVAIVTGEGRAFCSGHDLLEGFDEPMPDTGWAGLSRRYDLFKPLIAAVNGLAMGGGWEIALACDVVVADERAKFALPEPRVGFAALGGGANRLPLRMPWHIAMGLMLTGNSIDAQHAHRLGVVNEVAPAGEALTVARRLMGMSFGFLGAVFWSRLVVVLGRRGWRDPILLGLAVGAAVGTPFMIIGPAAANIDMMLSATAVSLVAAASMSALMPLVIQTYGPPHYRARLMSLVIMTYGLVGYGLGPPLIAFISQFWRGSDMALGYALSVTALVCVPGAALCYGLAWRSRQPAPMIGDA